MSARTVASLFRGILEGAGACSPPDESFASLRVFRSLRGPAYKRLVGPPQNALGPRIASRLPPEKKKKHGRYLPLRRECRLGG